MISSVTLTPNVYFNQKNNDKLDDIYSNSNGRILQWKYLKSINITIFLPGTSFNLFHSSTFVYKRIFIQSTS